MLWGQEVAPDLGRSPGSLEAFGPVPLLAEGLSSPQFEDLGSHLRAHSSLSTMSNSRAHLGRWWDVTHWCFRGLCGDFRTKGADGECEVLRVWKTPSFHPQAPSHTAGPPCAMCSSSCCHHPAPSPLPGSNPMAEQSRPFLSCC